MDATYRIRNVDSLGTPALVFYEAKIRRNIARMGEILGGFGRLRPHIKTHKCREILDMQMQSGVTRVKCATPKEAHFAAQAGVRDILLAYPIVGPLAPHVAAIQRDYPEVALQVLVDHPAQLEPLSRACAAAGVEVGVLVDVNSGMNRTGPRQVARRLHWWSRFGRRAACDSRDCIPTAARPPRAAPAIGRPSTAARCKR